MSENAQERNDEGTAIMDANSTAAEVLAKRGDVVLLLGKSPHRKLLVSTVLLSQVSPVFAAMFDGRFAEGQDLSLASPREVHLPDDDTEVMTIVCKIIHHFKAAEIPKTVSPALFANIAMTCHKYDCGDAVQAWSIVWVAHILEEPDVADFEKSLLATYLLDLAPEFMKVSKSLIRDRSQPSNVTTLSDDHDVLPVLLLERIVGEQRDFRERVDMGVCSIFPEQNNPCQAFKLATFDLLSGLRKAGLWPMGNVSIVSHIEAIKQLRYVESSGLNYCNRFLCPCCEGDRPSTKWLTARITTIYESVQGACLDCVKREEEVLGSHASCRVACGGNYLTSV